MFGFRSFLSATLTMVLVNVAFAGDNLGNGGDAVIASFMGDAREVVKTLKESALLSMDEKDRIGQVLESTRFQSTETLSMNGQTIYTLYTATPTPVVTVNRTAWQRLIATKSPSRRRLVAYTLLGAAGIDDSNYRISTRIFE